MSLLKKIVIGLVLATGVTGSVAVMPSSAHAEYRVELGPFPSKGSAYTYAHQKGLDGFFVATYLSDGERGPGWYLCN
jgi:hypothetical protein